MGFPTTMIIHLELTISDWVGWRFFLIRLDQTLLDFRNQILWNVASIMVLKVSPGPGAWVKHIILKINKPTTCKFGGDGRGRSIPQQIGSASMAVHWESPKHFFPFKKVQRLGRFWWFLVDRIPGERITTISELVIIDHDFWGHWFYKYLSMQSTLRQIHMENHGFQRNIIYKWYVFHTIPHVNSLDAQLTTSQRSSPCNAQGSRAARGGPKDLTFDG